MADIEYAIATRPIEGETTCGDLPWIKRYDNTLFMAMVDVAGHGHEAEKIAHHCNQFFKDNYQNKNLPEQM